MRSFLQKAALWLLAAIGLGPLISKAVEKWAERNGYLDDPTKGLQWVLGLVSSLADLWFFYPLIGFLAGLVVGLWLDRIARAFDDDRRHELASIGYRMLQLVEEIARRTDRSLNPWPQSVGDLLPELSSFFVRIEKAGIGLLPWTSSH